MRRGEDLGTFRRLLLMLIGLFLADNLNHGGGLSWMLGVFGVLVFFAAAGVIELAMALWYRSRRHQTSR